MTFFGKINRLTILNQKTRSNQTTNFMKKMGNFQNLLLGSREKDKNRDLIQF